MKPLRTPPLEEERRRQWLDDAWADVQHMRGCIWDDEYDTEPVRGEDAMRETLWALMVGSHSAPTAQSPESERQA